MLEDFSIPVSLQEVEASPQYSSEELAEGGLLEDCVGCLSDERCFDVDSCFSIYIHLLKQWGEVSEGVRVRYWSALVSGVRGVCGVMSDQELHLLSVEEKKSTRNKLKMLTYLLVQWVEVCENSCVTTTASKKSSTTGPSHWRSGRETSVQLLSTMMGLPLPSLWDPPSPSMLDDLASLTASCVYKLLESPAIVRDKALLERALALLGVLARDYGQGPAFSLKVPQLLRNFEHLVSPLATAVVMVAREYGVPSVVSGVVREMASNDPKDLSLDVSGTRCFAGFLVEVGGCVPALVLPVVSVLVPHLTGDSYSFRNGVLSVLGHLLLHLSRAGPDTPTTTTTSPRDQLLSKLLEHVYDTNAFVRVRVLQTMEHLVSSQAIPLHSLQDMLELACGRLSDKSSSVRKASLHLLTTTLSCNPFAAKLDLEVFSSKLESEESRLAELMTVSGSLEEEQPGRELTKQATVVSYLQNAVKFVETINKHIPLVVQMLGSKVTTDALEAINFLSKCASFGIPGAVPGVQRSLGLVWSNDASVRKAVLDVHIQLYLDPGEEGVGGRAVCVANNLVALVRGSSRGQLASLEKLLGMLVEGDYVTAPVIRVLWDTFQHSPADSALAVQVLSMVGSASPNVINNNFDLLIRTGLTTGTPDMILAESTCSALSKVAASALPGGKLLPSDHALFSRLKSLLVETANDPTTSQWAGLVEEAVVCVFRLCGQPLTVCEGLLHSLTTLALPGDAHTISSLVLSRLLFSVGCVAHRLMLYCETPVTRELKRRAALSSTEAVGGDKDGEELALAGASGDDPVIELVKRVLAEEVGGATGLLTAYEPLIVEVLVNPTKYNSDELTSSAALALGKYMLLSPCVCERYLRLFFTVLEKSSVECVRASSVILASDLACRFPNLIEPWTPRLYARLTDTSTHVRRNTLTVLTHLILNDMIKVRGQISAIALAIEDPDPKIADLAKHFFHELSSKGNTLYNVIPDIVSILSGGEEPVPQETFVIIIRYIFGLIIKDKQCESLVEKLCHRFRAVRSERQARDLAHCLSQLSLSERGVRRLVDNLPSYQDWLIEHSVFSTFSLLISKAKKSAKAEVKGQIDELEKLFQEAHQKGLEVTVATRTSPVSTPTGEEGATGGEDFSYDVLSSARRSLVRGTPLSSGRRGAGVTVRDSSPLTLNLDSDDEN